MGTVLQTFVPVAILLGVLVTVHESGHFFVAKLCGVKVTKFSIGFGPRLYGFTRGETEYRLAWIPLGGFVKMAGDLPDDEVPPEDVKRSFLAQPWWRRALIVAAGPAFNLIFPVVALFAVYIGDDQALAPKVGWVIPQTPADRAGIKAGDYIRAIDGHPIVSFGEISQYVADAWERQVSVTLERDGKPVELKLTPMLQEETNILEKTQRGLLGVSPIARPPILGVPIGSPAEAAGFKTFDRVLTVDGEQIGDELILARVLAKKDPGAALTVKVVRSHLVEVGGGAVDWPEVVELKVNKVAAAEAELDGKSVDGKAAPSPAASKTEQTGYAALGAEAGDLYVWAVTPNSPAAKAGLQRGDRLVSRDGRPILAWLTFGQDLNNLRQKPFDLTWRSGTEEKSAKLAQVIEVERNEFGRERESYELGMSPRMAFGVPPTSDPLALTPMYEQVTIHMGPKDAFVAAAKRVPEYVRQIGLVFGGLFSGKVPFSEVGGPILLAQVAYSAAQSGIATYLSTMALISVNLGLVNLLPIPVLDGFGLLSALWEGIRRRPIPIRAREYANLVGLAILALLVVMVFRNDIVGLFHSKFG